MLLSLLCFFGQEVARKKPCSSSASVGEIVPRKPKLPSKDSAQELFWDISRGHPHHPVQIWNLYSCTTADRLG